jgi:hypothetical protein
MTENISRRALIQSICGGLGSVGLTALLGEQTASAAAMGHYGGPHLPAKAKNIIFLFMAGGPSQIDMFDPKPALLKHKGERPDSVNLRTERQTGGLLPSSFVFKPAGKCGTEMSELVPQLATVADDLCVIRSMYTCSPIARRSAPGCRTAWVLKTRTCLRSSCSSPAAAAAIPRSGAPASCPPNTRAWPSTIPKPCPRR